MVTTHSIFLTSSSILNDKKKTSIIGINNYLNKYRLYVYCNYIVFITNWLILCSLISFSFCFSFLLNLCLFVSCFCCSLWRRILLAWLARGSEIDARIAAIVPINVWCIETWSRTGTLSVAGALPSLANNVGVGRRSTLDQSFYLLSTEQSSSESLYALTSYWRSAVQLGADVWWKVGWGVVRRDGARAAPRVETNRHARLRCLSWITSGAGLHSCKLSGIQHIVRSCSRMGVATGSILVSGTWTVALQSYNAKQCQKSILSVDLLWVGETAVAVPAVPGLQMWACCTVGVTFWQYAILPNLHHSKKTLPKPERSLYIIIINVKKLFSL